jgi:hypothetical protein
MMDSQQQQDHHNNNCGRCGHPKNTFQTIKITDLFSHLHQNHGGGVCQCGGDEEIINIDSQHQHHSLNGHVHHDLIHLNIDPSEIKMEHQHHHPHQGVPVIQQHQHIIQQQQQPQNQQYLIHGSHLQHQNQHAFISTPAFHDLGLLDGPQNQNQHQNHLQQQFFSINNTTEFNNTQSSQQPNHNNQMIQIQSFSPNQQSTNNYIHSHNNTNTATTTYLTVVAPNNNGNQSGGASGGIGVITSNNNNNKTSNSSSNSSGVTAVPLLPPPKPPRVPCTLCKKTFANDKFKTAHLERVHEKKSRFVCEICGAAFSYR